MWSLDGIGSGSGYGSGCWRDWVVVVLHYSDLLDLFGDVGDGRFGLGAFEGEPDGDEEEEEDYGGADADSEDNPEAETEDGGGVR